MDKKNLLIVFAGLFLVFSCVSVLAGTSFNNTLVASGNYSSSVITTFINISSGTLDEYTASGNITNITCSYNESGGATNYSAIIRSFANISHGQWYNFSDSGAGNLSDLSGLADSSDVTYPSTAVGYNFTCVVSNSTGDILDMISVANVTIDNTAPTVTAVVPTAGDYANVSGRTWGFIYFNLTIEEPHNDTIRFELYNSTALINRTDFTDGTSKWINWTNFSGGTGPALTDDSTYVYNVTVNDSAGNTATVTRYFTLDRVAPVPTLTSINATTTTLAITLNADGGTSGTNLSCWFEGDTTDVSIVGAGTSQILYGTGLNCGTTYSYLVSCQDTAGNSGSSSSTSFATSACPAGGGYSGGSSGSSSSTTWTNTYVTTTAQLEQGFDKQVASNERVRVVVSSQTHHVGVKEVTTTSATVEIASTPVEIKLDIGDDAKVDVTEDGTYYDIYVKLNSIVDGKADLTIKKIHELISTDAEGVSGGEDSPTVQTSGEVLGDEDPMNMKWVWIIAIVLILIVAASVVMKNRK